MAAFTATLIANESLGADVRRLRLHLSTPFTSLLAGQYVGLHAPDGELVYFSVASIAEDLPLLELHYAPTPGSPDVGRMHALLAAPDIALTEPMGNTGLFEAPDARDIVLIAAATGIAQAISIVRGWQRAQSAARITLYWGVREAQQLYASAQLNEWAQRHQQFSWHPIVSDDATWQGRTGIVVDAALADGVPQSADLVILSGSPAMVHASAERLRAAGIAQARIRSDML